MHIFPHRLRTRTICIVVILLQPLVQTALCANPITKDNATKQERYQTALETVLVTASRSPTTISAVQPHIITRSEIEDEQSYWVSNLLRAVPGIHASQSGPQGALTQIRVRGAEANQLLVLLDGIEMNDPALGSEVNFGNLLLTGVQRLEFLPGPQSALWGSDALAGVLALSTIPEPNSRLTRLRLSSGSWDTHTAGLNLSQASDRYYYSLNADYNASSGTNASLIGGEKDGYRNKTLHFNSGYFGEKFDFSAVLRSVRAGSEYDPTPFPEFVPTDGNVETNADQLFSRLKTTLRLFDDRWQQTIAYSYLKTDNDNFTFGQTTDGTAARKKQISYQSDLFLGSINSSHALSVALEHERTNFIQFGTPTFFGNPNQHQEVSSIAIISDYQYNRRKVTTLSLSARYDQNSDFEDAFSYRTALAHLIKHTQTKFFLSAGIGIKNPTFTERYGFTPDSFVGNPDLKPEHSVSYSLGIEQHIGSEQLFTATYFRSTLENEINGFAFDPALAGFTATNLPGASKRQGFELSFGGKLTDYLRYSTGYTWLNATEPSGGGQNRELRRPTNSAHLTVDADLWQKRTHIQVGVLYSGVQDDLNFATFPATREALNDYVLIHASSALRMTDQIKLTARIENILDERYQEVFGYQSPGRYVAVGLDLEL